MTNFYHQWIIGSKLIHIRSDTDCNRWVLVLKHSGSPQSTGRPWQVSSSFLFLWLIPHDLSTMILPWSKMLADFGYDISSYVDIDPIFGTLQDFDLLSASAKVRFNRERLIECEEEEKCSNILLLKSSCQLVGWSFRFTRVRSGRSGRSGRWSH